MKIRINIKYLSHYDCLCLETFEECDNLRQYNKIPRIKNRIVYREGSHFKTVPLKLIYVQGIVICCMIDNCLQWMSVFPYTTSIFPLKQLIEVHVGT